jgi:F420-0:gamma-glutamyl ligase-like protein
VDELTPLLFLAAFVAFAVFGIVRHGGFKGALFGARISVTVGEVEMARSGLVRQRVRVHVLEGKESVERRVGLELTQSAVLAWSMTPVSLSLDEARRLSELLSEAIHK